MRHLTSEDLGTYIAGEATGAEKAWMETHLASCESCSKERKQLTALERMLREISAVERREKSMTKARLIAAIWRDAGTYGPIIDCRDADTENRLFFAVKRGYTKFDLSYDAAKTAQLELMELGFEQEQYTESAARALLKAADYVIVEAGVTAAIEPAEPLLTVEVEGRILLGNVRPLIDQMIRTGNPPFVTETFDRLVRGGASEEEAVDMITKVFAIEAFHQGGSRTTYNQAIAEALAKLPNFPYEGPAPEFPNSR
jgi:hypothetical protein